MKKLAMPLALLTGLAFSALAAEPETEAVEFYNRALDHYFITATASEAKLLDDGAAGPAWVRTGRSFQAWLDPANAPANASPVCRFYSAGANSHFYTADAGECDTLKQLEAAERERARSTGAAILGWQYEGIAFRIESPSAGACPANTVPVSRVYNNGFATGEGSNHRFVDDSELRALMVDRSWINEGVALCSRSKSSGTNANLPATTSNFDAVAGTWNGTAQWERGSAHAQAAVRLDVSSSGVVTGTGAGCAFSGQLSRGDGFRSLFTGTLTAAGCSDAAFNGSYRRFDVERYGNGTLMLEAKLGDGASEASIEATLSSASAPVTPPTSATPASAGITGDWTGTVGWMAVRQQGGTATTLVAANRPLSLSVSTSGAVSGSGFGCAIAGSLSQASAGVFGGTITASGCTDANFNGAYANVKVKLDDARLQVELERESQAADVTTKVSIDGSLTNGSAAANSGTGTGTGTGTGPATPPPGIAGSFNGTFTADIEVRNRTTNATTTTSTASSVQLVVAAGGAITGSGFGCSFTGSIAPTATAGVFSGTVSASGCANAALNASYAATAHLENSGALSLEMQAETEANNVRTKATIKGTAARAS